MKGETKNDVIVAVASAVTVVDDDATRRPLDRRHGAAEPELIAEGGDHLLHIAAAAALHRAPHRTIKLQQAMVAEEREYPPSDSPASWPAAWSSTLWLLKVRMSRSIRRYDGDNRLPA